MIVVGVSPLDKDSTISVVQDGKVLFAAGEERFTRIKQQDGFPKNALTCALEYCGLSPDDVDQVAYPFMTWEKEVERFCRNFEDERRYIESSSDREALDDLIADALTKVPRRTQAIHGLESPNQKMEKGSLYETFYRFAGTKSSLGKYMSKRGSADWKTEATASFKRWESELSEGLREFGWQDKLRRMDHHLSHAANCYLSSGFERALIITLDGYGTGLAGSASEGSHGKIRRLHGIEFPHSLGTMYEHVTSSLGFRPSRHEGKIVGLASYGDPEVLTKVLLSRIEQFPGDFKFNGANNIYLSRYLATRFPKIDVAAAYQHVLEVVATNYVRHWVQKTGINKVVLSGGVAANVKLNQRVFEIEGVDEIFVYPNMGDGGCGTGAAIYNSWPDGLTGHALETAYFGPEFDTSEIERELTQAGLTYTCPDNLAHAVASSIHDGKVVARFDGRMEYGPRALGNRSIMYHAKEPEVNQWLNKRLGRTEFMPFAPVTLYEDRDECYKNISGAEHAAEFMTITFDCTDRMKKECPAAVHVDGTARPQLIRREVNPGYYDILEAYKHLTGVSSLINTSFNMHEEPIVCTPKDAVRAFVEGHLDLLAIGQFLAEAPENHG